MGEGVRVNSLCKIFIHSSDGVHADRLVSFDVNVIVIALDKFR